MIRHWSFWGLFLLSAITATGIAYCQTTGNDALSVAAQQVVDKLSAVAQARRGDVAAIDANTTPPTLYVTLGAKDGVMEGTPLALFAKGDPIVVNGQTVDYILTPVGSAEVVRVQGDAICAATLKKTENGQQAAVGNVACTKAVPGTLAVSTFLRPDGATTQMGQEFADKLCLTLQDSGKFKVVERARFEAVLAELNLGLNDLFDPQKAAAFGRQVPARGVVVGSITQQNDRYAIGVRVVDIETGVQVASAAVNCGRSTELDDKYGKIVGTAPLVSVAGGGPTAPQVTKRVIDDELQWIPVRPVVATDLTIGGILWRKMLNINPMAYVSYTLVLDGRWRTLNLEIGKADQAPDRSATLHISLDGKPCNDVDVLRGNRAVHVSLDVTGVSAVRFSAQYPTPLQINGDSLLIGDGTTGQ